VLSATLSAYGSDRYGEEFKVSLVMLVHHGGVRLDNIGAESRDNHEEARSHREATRNAQTRQHADSSLDQKVASQARFTTTTG